MSYSYNAINIGEPCKDRMRFELGDVQTDGGCETCALTDEEYEAVLARYAPIPYIGSRKWKKAKIELVKSVVFRFAYEVDTKVGPLSLSLSERHKRWQELYDELKAEESRLAVPSGNPQALNGKPYFYAGMHDNVGGGTQAEPEGGGRNVP